MESSRDSGVEACALDTETSGPRRLRVHTIRPATASVAAAAFALVVALPQRAHAAVATQVATSYGHVCAIDGAGGLWCWGSNLFGQVGDGTTTNRTVPVAVTGLASGVTAVSTGFNDTCAVTAGGGIKCWGQNDSGELGDGTTTDSSTPVDVVGLGGSAARVAVGGVHACAVTVSGAVKCWGDNARGQLGDGTNDGSSTPVDVVGLSSGVSAVTAGFAWSCAVTSGGGVKCWGEGLYGELGNGVPGDSNVPVDVVGLGSGVVAVEAGTFDTTCALTSGGGVTCWGSREFGVGSVPTPVAGLASGVASVSMGGSRDGVVLTTSGAVETLFFPFFGEPSIVSDVNGLGSGMSAVTAGKTSCALTTAGDVKCWGDTGALGEGPPNEYTGTADFPGCVAGFGDSDFDRICDSDDVCTAGVAFAHAPRPRLTVNRVNLDPVTGDDQITFHGRFSLPPGRSFADLDPLGEGARLVLTSPGGVVVDRSFVPAAYGGSGTVGWFSNAAVTRWTFIDATGPNGRPRAKVAMVDKSRGAPGGAVDVNVSINRDTLAVTADDTTFSATFIPGGPAEGAAGECAQTDFVARNVSSSSIGNECAFNARGTRLTCRLRRH